VDHLSTLPFTFRNNPVYGAINTHIISQCITWQTADWMQ